MWLCTLPPLSSNSRLSSLVLVCPRYACSSSFPHFIIALYALRRADRYPFCRGFLSRFQDTSTTRNSHSPPSSVSPLRLNILVPTLSASSFACTSLVFAFYALGRVEQYPYRPGTLILGGALLAQDTRSAQKTDLSSRKPTFLDLKGDLDTQEDAWQET
jgi:hypothetical protein